MLTESDAIDQEETKRKAQAQMEQMMSEHEEGGEADETPEPPPEAPEAPRPSEEETPPAAPSPEKETKEDENLEAPPATPESEQAPAPPTEEPDDVLKEIESVNLRDTAHPKTKKALKKVKEIAAEQRRERLAVEKREKEKDAEIERLKAVKLLDEPTEKELNDLRGFKRTVDIEHDPEFNQKYVEGAKNLEDQTMALLKRNGLPDSTAEFITKAGGALKFRTSQQLMPLVNDSAGNPIARHEDGTPYTFAEFFEKDVHRHLAPKDKDMLSAMAQKAVGLELDREGELSQARQNADKIFKEKAEKQEAMRADWEARFKAGAEKFVAELGDVAKKKDVPANATAVEKALIDAHNQRIDRAQGIAQRYAREWTPENVSRMAITQAYHETAFKDQMNDLEKENAQLKKDLASEKERNDKFKNAGKVSSNAAAPTKTKEAPRQEDPQTMMERQMNEMLAQQNQ